MSEKYFRCWFPKGMPRIMIIEPILRGNAAGFELNEQAIWEFKNLMIPERAALIKLPERIDPCVPAALQAAAQDQPPQGIAFYSHKRGGYLITWVRNRTELPSEWKRMRVIYV
ncbi:hypothetical protein KKC88_06140 [Patescibacteria group bacterium]|nr:hypothetical protein [Patescibacteria group bacterium]MBU1673937.1 hypothetical protein [Patescibacteria group bacterium]MBU1963931.1 hypothetical protein [Patescibacteria group bacterium]